MASGLSAADESGWAINAHRQPGPTPFNIDYDTKRARAKATGRSAVLRGSKTSPLRGWLRQNNLKGPRNSISVWEEASSLAFGSPASRRWALLTANFIELSNFQEVCAFCITFQLLVDPPNWINQYLL